MTLTLRPLDPATEAEVVHAWVTQEWARFWMMQDHTLEEVREIYQWIHDQPTHAAYLVRDGETPVGLFQTYDPRAEEVGEHVDLEPGDVGIHLLLAPPAAERPTGERGWSSAIFGLVLDSVFADAAVGRVLVEPDARNDKAVARMSRTGFEMGEVVELSVKPARIGWLTREAYERVFAGDGPGLG